MAALSAPFVVLDFGRTLYTAARLDYVAPPHAAGLAYRTDKPMTFWSNVILAAVFIPVIIAGAILLAREALGLAPQVLS